MTSYKRLAIGLCMGGIGLCFGAEIDLRKAVVEYAGTNRKPVEMLVEEIEKRTQVRLNVSATVPAGTTPAIRVKQDTDVAAAEGDWIYVDAGGVHADGEVGLGVVFAVGPPMRWRAAEQGALYHEYELR